MVLLAALRLLILLMGPTLFIGMKTFILYVVLALLLVAPSWSAPETASLSDPRTAINLERTAGLYVGQGHPALAVPLLEKALLIREQTLGPESLSVAATLAHLGVAYAALGDRSLAESALKRALTIREKILGRGHPAVKAVMNELDKLPSQSAVVHAR